MLSDVVPWRRAMYIYLIGFALLICSVAKSFVLLFVPRWFRSKKCIQGHRILITGAGKGLGRELAIEFSKHSVCLILVGINRSALLQTERLLDRSSTVFIYDCDVSDYRKVCELANIVQREAGDVDILVNNAGIVSGDYLLELEEKQIVKTMEVNALAHFWTCKVFLPAMMDKNRGHIVNVASMCAKVCAPGLSDYCASKFAALGFAESLAMELKAKKLDGVKVTVVNPSHIGTDMFAGVKLTVGNLLSPEYVAQEVVAGVLLDKETIYLPHSFKYLAMLYDLIPRWLKIKLLELSDNFNAFDDFKRRARDEDGTRDKSKKKE